MTYGLSRFLEIMFTVNSEEGIESFEWHQCNWEYQRTFILKDSKSWRTIGAFRPEETVFLENPTKILSESWYSQFHVKTKYPMLTCHHDIINVALSFCQ